LLSVDEDDERGSTGPLLPPEDRLWRHPSELGVERPRQPTTGRVWSTALIASLAGAAVATGAIAFVNGMPPRVVERQVIEKVAVQPVTSGRDNASGVVGIASRLSPAIVRLDVRAGEEVGAGSGVLFRDSGELLTNAHVVESADRIDVVLADGRRLAGEVVGLDHLTDIAVVRITGGEGEPFPTAALGTAANLRVGEPAIAIGSPLGFAGGPSVTTGVISALGRRVDNPGGEPFHDLIQTDAPIAPGSSGGALVDQSGAVIGITTVITMAEGAQFGFAVPIDIAHDVADDIITIGKALHVWLGIEGNDLPAEYATAMDVDGGAVVHEVMPASPASAAGLVVDDVVVRLGDAEISSMSALVVALRDHEPGEAVEVTYMREGVPKRAMVTLMERPARLSR
jgi:S1-C subfamily serine protease